MKSVLPVPEKDKTVTLRSFAIRLSIYKMQETLDTDYVSS